MRLEQKYFIPFMLIVATICVLMIIYFNFSFMGSQQERFLQRVDDGSALLENEYPLFFEEGSISPMELIGDGPLLIFFWSSWSGRSADAMQHLHGLMQESELDITVISAAVKDDAGYVRDIINVHDYPFIVVEGTEIYNETRLPGLPSLVAYRSDGSLYGAQLGFRQASDYDFLTQLFEDSRAE